MLEQQLDKILRDMQMKRTPPLSIIENGNVTFVVYPLQQNPGSPEAIYPILKITEAAADHTYFESGSFSEKTRVSGSNGSAANVNLKTDKANTLLLLTDPVIIYG